MDCYNVLEVKKDASIEEIRKSYKKLVIRYHPDKCKEEDGEEKFKKITKAYEILSNPDRRRIYDMTGQTEEGVSLPESFRNFVPDDMNELFGDCVNLNSIFDNIRNSGFNISIETFGPGFGTKMYERKFPFNGGSFYSEQGEDEMEDSDSSMESDVEDIGKGKKGKGKGKNLYYDLFVTFADVYKRKKKKVAVNRYRYNSEKGEYLKEKIKLSVPIDEGIVVFQGEADEKEQYDEPGDIVITIRYKPDSKFELLGDRDLLIKQDVSIYELYVGGSFPIILPNGKRKVIQLPDGLLEKGSYSKRIVVKGWGLPIKEEIGDLYIDLIVKFPQLKGEEVKQIEKLFPRINEEEEGGEIAKIFDC